ncbi:CIC11C00000001356 [Sungouiella intermedia]|uniref:Alpha-1,3/1,6-mannosyltransferase ALG2 n=1 Tax=Sungouiella intermedia TaxID=45354 RepID=A0A1L0DLQ5_9ASCO|nr:CIC11C00000001356 [[Candida] intermedia]
MTKIAFIHPDLGIGGAERLVVDAAVGLQNLGNEIVVYTSHCDKSHCFDEVKADILKVHVFGDFLPTTIVGKFHILCAIIRQLYLVTKLIVTGKISKYDYFIVDQLSFCVPLLSLFCNANCKVLFYCHFPDQLLAKKSGLAKMLYRVPFDALEEWTTGVSDQVVVNSTFTKSIFHNTFTHLQTLNPGVIYPCVDISQPDQDNSEAEAELNEFMKGGKFFLSINRFERLKNIELAIKAFAEFKSKTTQVPCPKLIIAGGFDSRVRENVEYLSELEKLCDELHLVHYTFRGKLVMMPQSTEVIFLPSVKTSIKNAALKTAQLLLYTPTFEHFGIVPVESMLNKTPVLAIDRGGPLESIVNFTGSNGAEATGFNRPNDVDQWAKILLEFSLPANDKLREQLGENGYNRAKTIFSREQMSESFATNLKAASKTKSDKGIIYKVLLMWKFLVGALAIGILAVFLNNFSK